MSVGRGRDWGSVEPFPDGGLVVGSDSALAAVVTMVMAAGEVMPAIAVTGGDLHRTLGGPDTPERIGLGHATSVEVDVARVRTPLGEYLFVAHALVGRGPFTRGSHVVMNSQWFGELDLGPRSHPGDGLLDVTIGSLGLRQRRAALARARTGTHVPHPSLTERRGRSFSFATTRPRRLRVDGVVGGEARAFEFDLATSVRIWI